MISTIVEIEKIKDFEEQGFYSKSYLALDKRLKREVAVKDIIYENLTSESDFEKHFEESLKLSLASHPRILPVYYVGLNHSSDDEKIPRIVTHYYKNGSLNKGLEWLTSQRRSIGLDSAIRFAHDIIQGLNHLHSLDIVHLDLKASNIFMGDDGRLVVGDFGKAKFIKDGVIYDPRDIYPAIAPAEATAKQAIDKTADIYQFGLLLYSMLCFEKYRHAIDNTYKIGTKALFEIYRVKPTNAKELKAEFNRNFKRFKEDVSKEIFPDRSAYPDFVPNPIKSIIHKCLASKVEDRYNNFLQIQADLNNFRFPKNVRKLYQHLDSGVIYFEKKGIPCELKITGNGATFDIHSEKNKRKVSGCCHTGLKPKEFRKELFNLMDEI